MTDQNWETARQFLTYLEKERHYSHHTVKAYEHDLKQFNDFLGDRDFSKVNKPLVKEFLSESLVGKGYERQLQGGMKMSQKYSSRSIARKLAALKSFFKYLLRAEVIASNPFASIRAPKISKKLPEYLEKKIVNELLDMPLGHPLKNRKPWEAQRDKAILELFYSTGMRLSELVNLSFVDIEISDNVVRVTGKGRSVRVIPFGDTAKSAILDYLARSGRLSSHPSDPLFISGSGKRISPRTIDDRLRRYFRKVSSATGFSAHRLRHTFATHLLDAGMSIRAVKELLGHKSLSTTQDYTHLQVEQMKKVFNRAHPHA